MLVTDDITIDYAKYYENLSNNITDQPDEAMGEEQETFETVNTGEIDMTNDDSDAEEEFIEDVPLVSGKMG